jgi:hypothetical protein
MQSILKLSGVKSEIKSDPENSKLTDKDIEKAIQAHVRLKMDRFIDKPKPGETTMEDYWTNIRNNPF